MANVTRLGKEKPGGFRAAVYVPHGHIVKPTRSEFPIDVSSILIDRDLRSGEGNIAWRKAVSRPLSRADGAQNVECMNEKTADEQRYKNLPACRPLSTGHCPRNSWGVQHNKGQGTDSKVKGD